MQNLHNDIERYLKGELSPERMHELERLALSDPFLADALEGAGEITPQFFAADVQELQGRIKAKTRKKDRTFHIDWNAYLSIAAGLLLLALSSWVLIALIQQQNSQELFKSENMAMASPPASTDTLTVVAPSGFVTPENRETPIAIVTQPSSAPPPEREVEANLQEVPPVAIADATEVQPAVVAEDEAERKKTTSTLREGKPLTSPSMAMNLEKSRGETDRRVIRGRVVSADDGASIPGVNVLIKGTNTGTVTDYDGNFQIELANEGQALIFSFIGMETKELATPDNTLNVEMKTDATQLSEVVVTGYAPDSRSLPDELPRLEFATPSGGRKAFQKYLRDKLIYPQQALSNQVEGKVTIQFTVNPTGELSDFQVVKGLGYGCDEEVIRLIKQGPKWAPSKKNDEAVADKVRVRMRFSLPKKK